MKKGMVIGLVLVGAFIVFPLIVLFSLGVSTNNKCVTAEAGLVALKEQSKNQYDSFWKSVKEVAQVPNQYSKDFQKTYMGIMEGRYKDKNPLMNWIKEANPNFDASLYKQVQQVIEAGRNDFKNTQKQMIDGAREYKTYIGQFPTVIFVRFLGFPKIKFEDYEPVTSDRTEDAFKTRKDQAVNVFDNSGSK